MKLLFHNRKQKKPSTGRIFPNSIALCRLMKNVTPFFPQFGSYLHFLVFFFPSNPKSGSLPSQPSTVLEHTLSLQRTAKGVVEKTTCLTAAWLFHRETEPFGWLNSNISGNRPGSHLSILAAWNKTTGCDLGCAQQWQISANERKG